MDVFSSHLLKTILDPHALAIIENRKPVVDSFLDSWGIAFNESIVSKQRVQQFIAYEQQVTQYSSSNRVQRWNAQSGWRANLFALAHALGIADDVIDSVIEHHWSHGDFDRLWTRGSPRLPRTQTVQRERPPLKRVKQQIGQLLTVHISQAALAEAFLAKRLCADIATSEQLAAAFDRSSANSVVMRQATSAVRGLILSYLAHGSIGLLETSPYRYLQELLSISPWVESIFAISQTPQLVIDEVQADVIGLCLAFKHQNTPSGSTAERQSNTTLSWHIGLLIWPERSAARTLFLKTISPAIQHQLSLHCAVKNKLAHSEASALCDTLLKSGVTGLIERRCRQHAYIVERPIVHQRLLLAAEQHLAAIDQHARKAALTLLLLIAEITEILNMSLALFPLVDDQPSSHQRIRSERRLWHRVPRKKKIITAKLRPKVRWGYKPPRHKRFLSIRQAALAQLDQLAETLSQRTDLSLSEAKSRITMLHGYGALGLIPKSTWTKVCDRRIVEFIWFMKFSRVEGSLSWTVILERVNRYAGQLELPLLSMQLMRALYSTRPRPPRWFLGIGDAAIGVQQNKSLALTTKRRLNAVWRIFCVPLRVSIAASADSPASASCWALVALDLSSQRPAGLWLSTSFPKRDEVALVLYQAVWHPGHPNYPLRGTPEVIQIPQSLLPQGLEGLNDACYWLGAKVQIVTDSSNNAVLRKLPYAKEFVNTLLPVAGHAFLKEQSQKGALSIKRAHEWLLHWIQQGRKTETEPGCFPRHNSVDYPLAYWKNGCTLPALDSPAAVALLPVIEIVSTLRDAVEHEGTRYIGMGFRANPGVRVKIRRYPFYYAEMPRHCFVEYAGVEWYLTPEGTYNGQS